MKLTSKQKKLYTPLLSMVISMLLIIATFPGNFFIYMFLVLTFAMSILLFGVWNGERIVTAIKDWANTDDTQV
jgi:hypothetical protein